MSYIPEADDSPFVHHFGYYNQPASNAVNQRFPLSATGFSMPGVSINGSGQLVIDAGVCVMVQLALLMERNDGTTYSASATWYNVTGAAYVGCTSRNVLHSSYGSYLRSPLARAVIKPSVQTTIECRLSATSGGAVSFTGTYPSTYHGRGWFSVTRYT